MSQAPRAAVASLVFLPFVLMAFPPPAQAGKRKVPARVVEAKSVALGYDVDDHFVAEAAGTAAKEEERRALRTIRAEIGSWGKYVVVDPGKADLLIAVRLGKPVDYQAAVQNSGMLGGPGGMRAGSMHEADTSSADDLLVVYDCVEGRAGKRLWRERKAEGLAGAPPPLFARFRGDVEETEAAPAKK